MKGQHLLNLGPQLFKQAFGLLKDSHKTKQGQTLSGVNISMETPAAEVQALAAYQSGDLVPASDSSEATSQLLQKDGPHHVLLAPSVFAEVTQMKIKSKP